MSGSMLPARQLVESLGEEALLDFLGAGKERKPWVKFTPERQLVFLRYLIRSGCIAHSAAVAGVTYETIRRFRANDKQFAAAEEAAQALHSDMVRALILERAEEGWDEDTFEARMVHQAKAKDSSMAEFSDDLVLTKRVRKKSDAMLLAYAKSRMPEFRERGDVIANNASGGVLVVNQAPSTSQDWEKKFGPVEAEHEVLPNDESAPIEGGDPK